MTSLLLLLKKHWFTTIATLLLLLFSAMIYLLPDYVERRLDETLRQAGYTQIALTHVQWSASGLGMKLAELKASGADLPALEIQDIDIWLQASRLWHGALGVRLRSTLLAGDLQVRFWHDLWAVKGDVEVRFDGIGLSQLIMAVPKLSETMPFFTDKSLDGQLWLAASSSWDDWPTLATPVAINASLADVSLVHHNKTPLLSLKKLRLIDALYVFAAKQDMLVAADIQGQALSLRNLAIDDQAKAEPMAIENLHIKGLSLGSNMQLSIHTAALRGLLMGESLLPLASLASLEFSDVSYAPEAKQMASVSSVAANQFTMRNAGLNADAAPLPIAAEHFSMQGVSLANNLNLNIKKADLIGLQIGEAEKNIASLKAFEVFDLRLQPQPQPQLSINHVDVSQGRLFVAKMQDGQWQPWDLLLASLPAAKSKQADQVAPMQIAIKTININAIDLTMTDGTFTRDKLLKANIQAATLHDVMHHQAKQPMGWQMQGSLGENGAWTSAGTIWLDDLQKEADATLIIQALELAPYSGYVERKFGSGIQSGNMDTDLKAKVRHGEVDVEGTLMARKVSLKSSASFMDVGKDWSLSSAVDVLRDSDNNVNLDISVEGQLSDPQFKVSGLWDKVLKEAMQRSAISYLTQTMQPYGLAFTVAQYLYEQSKTIELKPFVFETGLIQLTPKSPDLDGYSEKIAQLLKKKTTYILEICPRFVAEETAIQESLSKERTRLLTQRLQTFDLLPVRWTVCEPKLDKRKQAISRLELRLL